MYTSNIRSYDRQPPEFYKPELMGYFSITPELDYMEGSQNLNYLRRSNCNCAVNFNLNHHLGPYLTNEYEEKGKNLLLLHILTWIQNHQDVIVTSSEHKRGKRLLADFVSRRGLFSTVMTTPYENSNDWQIVATKYRGTIYMYNFDSRNRRQEEFFTVDDLKRCAWGYKFEQYMMTDSPSKPPDVDRAVDSNVGFMCLIRSKLNHNSILYAAEVDALDYGVQVDPGDPLRDMKNLDKFVELKTSRVFRNEKQERNFKKYKLIKWWAQSFLVGIPKVIGGFRDDDGIVSHLKTYNVMDMPHIAQGLWKFNVCMNFLNDFLNLVKSTVTEDNPHTAYIFQWSPASKKVTVRYVGHDHDYELLPEWYIKLFN